jgi:RecB family endonuclease NucS
MGATQGKSKKMAMETEDARERAMMETITKEPTKTEYRIIVENCSVRLTERVNEMLNEGWELQGGVSGHTRTSQQSSNWTSHTPMWAQAMIKKH